MPELPNAVGIDKGIHNRVGMGEDDGDVQHPDMWAVAALTQVVETVDDMHRKPT